MVTHLKEYEKSINTHEWTDSAIIYARQNFEEKISEKGKANWQYE